MAYSNLEGADLVRSCTSKKAYPTQAVARLSIRSIMVRNPSALVRAYSCSFCHFWHVGATPLASSYLAATVTDAATGDAQEDFEDGESTSRSKRSIREQRRRVARLRSGNDGHYRR